MQPNKTKIALVIGALLFGASGASNADPFTANVTTIDDVTILTVPGNDLSFGTNVFTTAGTCTMSASAPGSALMQYDDGVGVVAQTTWGDLSSAGTASCVVGASLGTPGVYEVKGVGAGAVSVLLTEVAQVGGDFTFDPSGGCYTDFDAVAGPTADTCTTLNAGTVVPTFLAAATAVEDEGTGTHASVEGTLRFTVGGTITVGATGLTAETPYNLAFQVDVTY
ncbi:MAG: hypothetical protein QNK36_05210 [Colwellia sp.]|nr:hypothetical protein [Colwellia sp.]